MPSQSNLPPFVVGVLFGVAVSLAAMVILVLMANSPI
jgi:hypothetical protein